MFLIICWKSVELNIMLERTTAIITINLYSLKWANKMSKVEGGFMSRAAKETYYEGP